MTDYDPELEIIKAKKLLRMKKKASGEKPKSDRELLLEHLFDRGSTVLATAERQYPKETTIIIAKLAELIKSGELQGGISGGALLALFRSIGLNVRMETKISVEEHGRIVSLADRLKQNEE